MRRQLIRFMAGPLVPFAVLPAFMIVLVAGTVAQRYIGLYESQKLFFYSIILWAGPMPLPGGLTLTALLTLGLIIKFLFFSAWRVSRAGINLAHLGVLVLLIGGLATALSSREGYVLIPEGAESNIISDYRLREFVILQDGKPVAQAGHDDLQPGKILSADGLPVKVEILSACSHCAITRRKNAGKGDYRNMAQFMEIAEGKPAAQDEANISGVTFRVFGAARDENGIWLTFDPMPKPIQFKVKDHTIDIVYRRRQRSLPFTLKLQDFVKQEYPGTDMPSHYNSSLIVRDNGIDWPVLVEMNKPLRYKGYTLFQSSFVQDGDNESTVLAAVQNPGWPFPYIGSGLMAIGLLLHLFLSFRQRRAV